MNLYASATTQGNVSRACLELPTQARNGSKNGAPKRVPKLAPKPGPKTAPLGEKLLAETHVGPRFWTRKFAAFVDPKRSRENKHVITRVLDCNWRAKIFTGSGGKRVTL